ncbi:MAG TPA: hypothetical protein VE221_05855 [Sphingomicrobium sp.]|nr:hypothetical protein [Sphingomicrobium sp.]
MPPIVAPAEVPIPDSIEYYPQLNIRVLLDRGELQGDRVGAKRLGWTPKMSGVRSIYLIFDRRPEGMPLLIARIETLAGEITWQNIRLLPGLRSGKPRYMLCPIGHLRSEIFYFRNGIFASRDAQGLYNPSQRSVSR